MSETAPIKGFKKEYFLPDIGDIIFFVVLYLLLYIKCGMLFDDGSTGWHLVSGNYILEHHSIPHTDLMSYTFANKPWIAYEWLSDLLMAIIVKAGGLNLLYVTVASAIGFLIVLLYRYCRQNGTNFVMATVITILGALLSAIHWLARPHLFTFFGILIFTTQLERYYRGFISKKKLAFYLTLYMLIWVNSHPGFLLGLVLIAVYLFCTACKFIFLKISDKDINQQKNTLTQIKTFSSVLILNIIASLCTPYGIELYKYICNYLFKASVVIAATDEFQSPIFHGALQPSILEILFALTVLGLIISRNKLSLPNLAVYLMFAHLSLSAQRNMALYVIAGLPIIAYLYAKTEMDPHDGIIYTKLRRGWQLVLDKCTAINDDFTETEKHCKYHLLPLLVSLVLIIIALNGGKVLGYQVLHTDFNKTNKPSTTLDTIRTLHLDAKHGFSLDNWGGIIRYKLDYPVFIDDRADFYGTPFYLEYAKLFHALAGWQTTLKKYQIEWVLLPKDSRLTEELKTNYHWQTKGEDQASILLIAPKKI